MWNSEENTFVIFPLKKAAITVPIPTDGNSGSKTKEATAEPATEIEEQEDVLVRAYQWKKQEKK